MNMKESLKGGGRTKTKPLYVDKKGAFCQMSSAIYHCLLFVTSTTYCFSCSSAATNSSLDLTQSRQPSFLFWWRCASITLGRHRDSQRDGCSTLHPIRDCGGCLSCPACMDAKPKPASAIIIHPLLPFDGPKHRAPTNITLLRSSIN